MTSEFENSNIFLYVILRSLRANSTLILQPEEHRTKKENTNYLKKIKRGLFRQNGKRKEESGAERTFQSQITIAFRVYLNEFATRE